MDEQDERTKTALFRYGVIAPLVCRRGDSEQMRQLKVQILSMQFAFPDGSLRSVPDRTLRHWLSRYKKQGFEGLLDVRRSDRGKSRAIPEAVLKRAEELRREQPSRSISKLTSILEKEGYQGKAVAERTLGRQLVKVGATKERLKKGAGSYRRWEQLYANDLWQGDVSHGVWLRDPLNSAKAKKTKLIVFIDDATRVCTHAEFYFDEQLPNLIDCFGKALLKRGRPCRMLFDNGSIYRSTSMATMAAELGIEVSFCRPRAPQGKGKVERFIRTVQEGFFKEASCAGVERLDELNALFQSWLKKEYHDKQHSELEGLTPFQRWEKDIQRLSLVTVDELRRAALLRARRRVQPNTATISVDGREYQASTDLAGQEVEVRWNPGFQQSVEIWLCGDFVEIAQEFKIKNWVEPRIREEEGEELSPGTPLASSKTYFQKLMMGEPEQGLVSFKQDEILSEPEFARQVALAIGRELEPAERTAVSKFFRKFAPMYRESVAATLSRSVSVKGSDLHMRYYLEQLEQSLRRR